MTLILQTQEPSLKHMTNMNTIFCSIYPHTKSMQLCFFFKLNEIYLSQQCEINFFKIFAGVFFFLHSYHMIMKYSLVINQNQP